MKHLTDEQGPHYSIAVEKLYDVTMELVKGNKYLTRNWEKVADLLQRETANHKTFQAAVNAVKRKIKKYERK